MWLVGRRTLSVCNEPKVEGAVVIDKTPDAAQPAAKERRVHICVCGSFY